jgi:cytochrome c oxidase subunit 3
MTDSHGSEGHPAHLQHHFDNDRQQFSASKLGMWLFLATEILLFAGLFVAYAVYRSNHPEIFIYASQFLDTTLGGINTMVLLLSSFTMAWGVRAAQLGQKKLLVSLLAITLLGGFGFLGIKYVEYEAKWKHGLLWGVNFNPASHDDHGEDAGHAAVEAEEVAPAPVVTEAVTPEGLKFEPTVVPPSATGPAGTVEPDDEVDHDTGVQPENVQIFFGIYFLMTGLHGIHVLVGMSLIFWILLKSMRGAYGPKYFTPVDLVGLYWHLVDLIWIFLFPLLYLIH